jgi:DHA1 family bicyclomycin/chloramphenicol resistance-like MFS transporter
MNAPEADRAAERSPTGNMSTREFIGLVAVMMSLTAMTVDVMLPALPQIGEALGVTDPNDRQYVVVIYMLGFSIGQLVYGRLSDTHGRKPVLMVGMAIFIAGSLAASVASGFMSLLLARAVQGLGAAAPRVLAIAIVRDRFAGRQMARVMSFAMAVFIILPVLAPGIGQGVLSVGTWRHIFDLLLVVGVVVALWAGLRLPETVHVADSGPLPMRQAISQVLGNRQTLGYGLASGLVFGCVLSYVASAQQIFVDVYDLGAAFPLAFGAIALTIGTAALTNARFVERLGMRFVSHTALAIFLGLSLVLIAVQLAGLANVWVFMVLMAVLFFVFGLVAPNFNALAMEPQGDNAGMASSLVGFLSTAVAAVAAAIIGHMFDDSVLPLGIGFAVLSVLAFAVIAWVEGPRCMFGVRR